MTRTGIKLDLDVGDLVSNAGRARGAIAALGEAMKKAEQDGALMIMVNLPMKKKGCKARPAALKKISARLRITRSFKRKPQTALYSK
jgi:hypothetical protein